MSKENIYTERSLVPPPGKKKINMLPHLWSGDFPESWSNPGILESSLSLSKLHNLCQKLWFYFQSQPTVVAGSMYINKLF